MRVVIGKAYADLDAFPVAPARAACVATPIQLEKHLRTLIVQC
jgi:hypothetical protein